MRISFILWKQKKSLRNSEAGLEESNKDVRHGYHWIFETIVGAQIAIEIRTSYVTEGLLVWDPKTAVKKKHFINHWGFWRSPLLLLAPQTISNLFVLCLVFSLLEWRPETVSEQPALKMHNPGAQQLHSSRFGTRPLNSKIWVISSTYLNHLLSRMPTVLFPPPQSPALFVPADPF